MPTVDRQSPVHWPLALGVALIAAACFVNYRAYLGYGQDFSQLYVAAQVLTHGGNIYDFRTQSALYQQYAGVARAWGHFYPPGSGALALPFTLVPYGTARLAWFVLCLGAMLYGLWRFLAWVDPTADARRRAWRPAVIGAIACTSSARWAFWPGQFVPVVLGLLAVFIPALASGRSMLAAACALAASLLKATFALPFLALMLLRRSYGLAAAVIAIWAGVNGLAALRMGGPHVFADYRLNMAQFERPDQMNNPDPRGVTSLPRLDWPYLLNAIRPDPPASSRVAAALTFASLALLLWEARRLRWPSRDVTALRSDAASNTAEIVGFLGPLCCLALLSVYHHHYDILLLSLPLLGYLAGPPILRGLPGVTTFAVAFALYGGLWPASQSERLAERLAGQHGLLVVRPLGCSVLAVMFIASLVALHRLVSVHSAAAVTAPASEPRADLAADAGVVNAV